MNRADAARKVAALREVRTDRGATAAEAQIAKRKAAMLSAKFGLEEQPRRPPPRRASPPPRAPRTPRAPRAPRAPKPAPTQGRPAREVFAEFAAAQAKVPPANVKVHYYKNAANWRIEILR